MAEISSFIYVRLINLTLQEQGEPKKKKRIIILILDNDTL